MGELSRIVEQLKPSATIVLAGKVREMIARGEDVLSFTIGEPDFDTPDYIKAGAVEAIEEGFTKYTPASGIKELREAISAKLHGDNGVLFPPDDIIATSGGKHALSLIFQVLCNEGDEVIIPSPYWVSYLEQVKLAGGVPVIVKTSEETGFKITPEALAGAITGKTKLLVLNSPSNPTGTVYTGAELEKLSEVVLSSGMLVVSDEVYETIIYDGAEHVSIASLGPEIKKRTVIVNSLSKTYAMPGWRIGYAAGEKNIIKAMASVQSQTTSHPDSIAQKAALTALTGPQESVKKMAARFEERRNLIMGLIRLTGAASCLKPAGAFYLFPNISNYFGKSIDGVRIGSSSDIADILLSKAGIAVVPGAEFGAGENVRISYAVSEEQIKTGMERMGNLLCRAKG